MFCVLLIVVYLSLSVLFLIRTEWFKECCGNLWNQWKNLHFSIKSFALIFVFMLTLFAANKPEGQTRSEPPPGTESTPMASEIIITKTFSDSKTDDNSKDISMVDDPWNISRDFYESTSNIFTRVVTNTATWLTPPTNHMKYSRWQNYGVAEDSFWIPATNWNFVYGSNLVEGAYISSSGTISFEEPKSSSVAHGLPDGTGLILVCPHRNKHNALHMEQFLSWQEYN